MSTSPLQPINSTLPGVFPTQTDTTSVLTTQSADSVSSYTSNPEGGLTARTYGDSSLAYDMIDLAYGGRLILFDQTVNGTTGTFIPQG